MQGLLILFQSKKSEEMKKRLVPPGWKDLFHLCMSLELIIAVLYIFLAHQMMSPDIGEHFYLTIQLETAIVIKLFAKRKYRAYCGHKDVLQDGGAKPAHSFVFL